MFIKIIQKNYSQQKTTSLFGKERDFNTGVYAVSEANHLASPTAYSHTLKEQNQFLREATPINKLPSYVLGFTSILIVVVVKAATILIKSPNLLVKLISNVAPRGINVESIVNKVSVNIMVIGRMVYENASRLKLRRFLKMSNSLLTTLSYFSLRAF